MKIEQRRKKQVLGMVLYTFAIVQLSTTISLSFHVTWWLWIIGAGIYFPISLVGINLMIHFRWW